MFTWQCNLAFPYGMAVGADNDIGVEGGEALAAALGSNTTLRTLVFSGEGCASAWLFVYGWRCLISCICLLVGVMLLLQRAKLEATLRRKLMVCCSGIKGQSHPPWKANPLRQQALKASNPPCPVSQAVRQESPHTAGHCCLHTAALDMQQGSLGALHAGLED